jgi:hypothetical protein
MSEWKQRIPTVPGYYWVFATNKNPSHHPGGTVIWELDEDGNLFGIGDGSRKYYPQDPQPENNEEITAEVNSYYFLGPIEVPAFKGEMSSSKMNNICPVCGAIITVTKMIFYQVPDTQNPNRLLNVEKGIYNCGHDDPRFPAMSTSYSDAFQVQRFDPMKTPVLPPKIWMNICGLGR